MALHGRPYSLVNGLSHGGLRRYFTGIFSGVPGPGGISSREITIISRKIIRMASESVMGSLTLAIPTSDGDTAGGRELRLRVLFF